MGLLMEYIVICIFLYIGITIPSSRNYWGGQEEIANREVGREFGTMTIDNSQAK
jgi:hypothetical protein